MAARLLEEAEKGEASVHWHYIRALPSVEMMPANLPAMSPVLAAVMDRFSDGLRDGSMMQQRIRDGLNCVSQSKQPIRHCL